MFLSRRSKPLGRTSVRRRRRLLERLERRELLAGDWTDQRDRLSAEVDSLESFAETVESAASLNTPLGVLGSSFNAAFDFSDSLASEFITPMQTALAAAETPEAFAALLTDLPSVTGEASTRLDGGERVFETSLFLTRSVEYQPDFNPAADELGLRFDAESSTAAFGITLELTFGVDAGEQFFAEVDRLDFSVVDAVTLRATELSPQPQEIDQDLSLTVRINDRDAVNVTLPAATEGDLTPVADRLNALLGDATAEGEFKDGLRVVEHGGRLELRAVSPLIESLSIAGDAGLEQLGFISGSQVTRSFLPAIDYGLVALQSDDGGLVVDGSLRVTADGGPDGRFDSVELGGDFALTEATTGFMRTAFDVRPTTESWFEGSPRIIAENRTLFRGEPVRVRLESFQPIDTLHDEVVQSVLQGFDAVAAFGTRLETESRLANRIPGLDTTFADQAKLGETLADRLKTPVESVLAANPRPSWDELADAIENSGPGIQVLGRSSSDETLALSLEIDQATPEFPAETPTLALGEAVLDRGFAPTGDLPAVPMAAATEWTLDIAVDRRQTGSPLNAFAVTFGETRNRFAADALVGPFAADLGVLGVTANGSGQIDANFESRIGAAGEAISAARLLAEPIETLVSTTETGTLGLNLGLTGTVGGQTINDGAMALSISGAAIFAGQSELQLELFPSGALADFAAVTPEDLAGGLSQLASWLGDFAEERLGDGIPLAERLRYEDVIPLRPVFEQLIVDPLTDEDDALRFSNVGELVAQAGISNPNYDAASQTLTFEVEFSEAISEALTDSLRFDFGIGDLVGLETDGTLSLASLVSGRMRFGIDMRPLGAGDAAVQINRDTALESLGVNPEAGDDIEITLRDGSSVRVDFHQAVDLGDVLDRIEASSPLLSASLRSENGVLVGIEVTDQSADDGQPFAIRAVGDSLVGLSLGILDQFEADEDDGGEATIEGRPLHGETLAHRVFVEEINGQPIAGGYVELDAASFTATANLGFTEVTINGGELLSQAGVPSHLTASASLPQSKMTLADLFEGLASGVEVDLGGLVQVSLPISSSVGGETFGGAGQTLIATLTDFRGDIEAAVSGSIDPVLEKLADIDAGDVMQGLLDGLKELLEVDGLTLPVVDIRLPEAVGLIDLLRDLSDGIESIGSASLDVLSAGVNRISQAAANDAGETAEKIDFPELEVSLTQLFSFFSRTSELQPIDDPGRPEADGRYALESLNTIFADVFDFEISLPTRFVSQSDFSSFLSEVTTILDRLQLSGPGSLQGLEAALVDSLGLPAESIGLRLDTSDSSTPRVRFDIALEKLVEASYPLRVDLDGLGVAGIGDLVDVSGSSEVSLSAGATALLSLGVEVGASGVKPFLYTGDDGSRLTLSAGAVAEDIDFEASLGPLGIGIVDGTAGIGVQGADPQAPLQPATFELTFDDADGRYYLLDESLELSATATGGAVVRLPIEAPSGTAPIHVQMDVADLVNPSFQFSLWEAGFAAPSDLTGDGQFDSDDVAQAFQDKIDSFGDLGDNLLSLVGGWEGGFDLLIDAMKGEVLGVPLPILGDALADQATFLEDIKSAVLDNIANGVDQSVSVVQTAIFDALGPGGLGMLRDRSDDADSILTVDDVKTSIATDRVEFDIDLGKDIAPVLLAGGFDLGLPGLNFDLEADVSLDLDFDFQLGFGVSLDEGFYFVTDNERTNLEVVFTAEVTDLEGRGQLAFLELTAENVPDAATHFVGKFDVDLVDPGQGLANDGRVSLSEMYAGDFSEIVQHSLSADTDAALRLELSAGGTSFLPRIRADLLVNLDYGSNTDPQSPDYDGPNGVDFENVQLNLGDFFSGFAGETLGEVKKILRPIQPILDTLTGRLPVISDLGGRDVSLVDLAKLFGRADVANFIESIKQVNDLILGLPAIDGDSWVDLGAFQVDIAALGGYEGVGSAPSSTTKDLSFSVTAEPSSSPLAQTSNQGGGGWTNTLEDARGSLSFPLLESPSTVFSLLLGKDVDLFLYDAPALGIDFRYYQSFPTPIPALFAELGGRIAAVADFAFGFDTSGISRFQQTGNALDVFDGFFVSDRENADGTGRDVAEAYLRGSITAGAKVSFLIAEAGVRGGVFAGVDFNLHDQDGDGRVRAGEIAESLALGPIHVFDVDGRVDAGLSAFLNVNLLLFQINEEYELARVNLLDFEIARPTSDAPRPEDVLIASRTAKSDGSGDVLTIQFTQQDDNFKILPGSETGSIVIQGNGLITGDLFGVTEIVGNAGDGNDTVTVSPDVTVPIDLRGGSGDDVLTVGGGAAVLRGDAGNDQLTGSSFADELHGGEGNDIVIAGDGDDRVFGDQGNDFIDGGRGNDRLVGGEDDDMIAGGFGTDQIDGESGNDQLAGDEGDDFIDGGVGDDELSGGRGDDHLEGGDGDDQLFGQEGADVLHGGRGNDLIEGGQRNDVIRGGEGNDTLDGGTGNDELFGDEGDDFVRGGAASDQIDGGSGNDHLYADTNSDVNSDVSSHVIFGGSGDDVIFGAAGSDFIEAGDGNDQVNGFGGDDVIIGGFGNDELDGGDGSDLVWGGLAAYEAASFDPNDPSLFELPPRFVEATTIVDETTGQIGYSGYVLPKLITPIVVAGQSVAGVANDGRDQLRGGDGTDWLFGGSGNDALFGGGDADYLDAGSGDDADVFGGDGDDVIRGGAGSDVIHGGAGIDQIYGDGGRDTLYGDAGIDGSTDGQRLFGGEGVDSLFAWAANPLPVDQKGDQLFGGADGDFLYGNVGSELLFGEGGADFLSGDWAAGPNYQRNPLANQVGGNDFLIGGSGPDQVYGGGGDDLLRGGGDGDWLEGQDGNDQLLGGGGIDFLVLGTRPGFSEQLDGHGSDTADDQATDILMINGSTGDDVIRIGSVGGQLRVAFEDADAPENNYEIFADWTADGVPLVEQFRVAGLSGDDIIEFESSLDVSALTERSRDFVTRIDGGPGNDTLIGTSGRDRIDGGRGSDAIFGRDGDDRLWGDQGSNDGSVNDHDVIYAGGGNDDLLGGQGTNTLFAWSSDPGAPGASDFGVFELVDGAMRLEDTGLNRIIGGPGNDDLYGGTGLDLLYGADGENRLFTRTGASFESLDGGEADDAWKQYAQQSDQVWYVGGTNTDDVISVDFVTEPGILVGHHLVTRSTNNNNFFSFDAQVRLDFAATDDNGDLIWDPDQLFAGSDSIQSDDPFARADALNQKFSDRAALSRLLPPEDDFRAIIIDALAGDDVINVGPTVQKTVWIDAGDGDDRVSIAGGEAILIDQTDAIGQRNDTRELDAEANSSPYPLQGGPVIVGESDVASTNGILTADASFYLIVDELEEHVLVEIPASVTNGEALATAANTSIDDLIDDINRQLNQTAAAGLVIAIRADGSKIALASTSASPQARLAISAEAGDAAVSQLGLPADASAVPTSTLSGSITYSGLTIDNPDDVDFYQFSVAGNAQVAIHLASTGEDDGMTFALYAGDNVDPEVAQSGRFNLSANTTYTLRIESNSVPTIYELNLDFPGDADASVVGLGAVVDFERRDVIFGGDGNDTLQGGPGEDFVFGGLGNDVLTGGFDRGASDLLFGQAGDDVFQTIPDALPKLSGTETTFLPTQSDRFDGGDGNNQVVFVGGDLDRRNAPVPDFAAMRYDRFLQRYEVSALVWDVNNQRFVPAESADDLNSGSELRRWHFFTTVDIDTTVFDLGAGADVLRLDAPFTFDGDQTGASWGIREGDLQAGAEAFSEIRVIAGDGNDRIFGGDVAERIEGGNGTDFIAGGLGDDSIEGGQGDDLLYGNTGTAPDAYEFVTRSFGDSSNDTYPFAADLEVPPTVGVLEGFNFHEGDSTDWYAITPKSLNQFAGQSSLVTLYGRPMMVAVDPQTGEEFDTAVFAAEATGNASEPNLVPVNELDDAAEAFLLRVQNQLSSETDIQAIPRDYHLEFRDPYGRILDVAVSKLAAGDSITGQAPGGFLRSAEDIQIRLDGTNLGGQSVILPVGNFNGDVDGDGAALLDTVITVADLTDPVSGQPVSYVRMVYGGDSLLDPTSTVSSATSGTIFKLPGTLLSDPERPLAISGAGDIDRDGFDDLAISVTDGSGVGNVYLVFGRDDMPALLDVAAEAEAGTSVAVLRGFDTNVDPRIVGDINNDGLADLIAVDSAGAHLFVGRGRSLWQPRGPLALTAGVNEFTFDSTLEGFTHVDNDPTRPIWRQENGRLVMGGISRYANRYEIIVPFQPPIRNIFPTTATATSPLIDLRDASNATLIFDHLLQTDEVDGRDIAQILVEVDGQTVPLEGADNQGGSLTDGMNPAGAMETLSYDLSPFEGKQIRLVFDFDSVNPSANEFYGWAIDNLRIESDGVLRSDADRLFAGGHERAAPLGDFDRDGIDDFALSGRDDLLIYFGAPQLNNLGELDAGFSDPGYELFAAGFIDGDEHPDAVFSASPLCGRCESYLVLGNGRSAPELIAFNAIGGQPIGDFNGDGLTDLAIWSGSANQTFDDPDQEIQIRWAAGVYLSEPGNDLVQKLGGNESGVPDVVFQMPDVASVDPQLILSSNLFRYSLPLYGAVGDLNGDGRPDLGLAPPFQSSLGVVFGDAITPAANGNEGDDPLLPVEFAVTPLASSIVSGLATTPSLGIDLSQSTSSDLRDAVSIEGDASNARLASARSIGDIDDDGFVDVVLSGATQDWIVFGPFTPDGTQSIDQLVNIRVPQGRVVEGSGDLNGDGIDDLVIEVGSFIEVYHGGGAFDRDLIQGANTLLSLGIDGVSLLDWDGDSVADLLGSASESNVEIYAGNEFSLLQDFSNGPFPEVDGAVQDASTPLTFTPIGDVDGDGRDDLAVASADRYERPDGTMLGGVVLALSGSGPFNAFNQGDLFISGENLSSTVLPLGDLNQDGYDDFGVVRSKETTGQVGGGLLIYFGQATYDTSPSLGIADADIRISRPGASSVVFGSSLTGPIHAAAGDLNGDGRADLVVGSPSQTLVDNATDLVIRDDQRGEVAVFFDILGKGESVRWDAADRRFSGTTRQDRAGSHAAGKLPDFNADGLDDVTFGAAGFDGLLSGIKPDAGRLYSIPGTAAIVDLPDDGQVTLLENASGRLVDRQTGSAETFGPFQLSDSEAWFRFTTAGDGTATSTSSDHIRVTPGAFFQPLYQNPTATGSLFAGGTVTDGDRLVVGGDSSSAAIMEFDLRNVARQWAGSAEAPNVTLQLNTTSNAGLLELSGYKDFTALGDGLIFVADDPVFGTSLFVTDGSTAQTRRLELPGIVDPENVTAVGDRVSFTANPSGNTIELWISDGTEAGTTLVRDDLSNAPQPIAGFTSGGGKLFFATGGGTQIWESDLTAAGTQPIRTFSNFEGSDPQSLTIVESDVEQDPIVFVAADDEDWSEPVLYATGGNNSNDPDGLFIVGEPSIGNRHNSPHNFHAFDGFLALQASGSSGNNSAASLLVTNGVMEGGGNTNGIRLSFTANQPRNPTDMLTEVDAYELTPSYFDDVDDYNAWLALGYLNRDYLYVIADDPNDGNRGLFRVGIDPSAGIFDNGIRSSGLVERENYRVRLRGDTIAENLVNPDQLVRFGNDLFFVAESANGGREVFRVSKSAIGATPQQVSSLSSQSSDADPQDLIVVGDRIFFTALNGDSRDLYTISPNGFVSRLASIPSPPEFLSAAGERLTFVVDNLLWSSDGTSAGPIVTDAAVSTGLTVGVLDGVGDGIVDASDLATSYSSSVEILSQGRSDSITVDLSAAVAQAISEGRTSLTLRIEAPAATAAIAIDNGKGLDSDALGLRIEPRGVLADLISNSGRVISQGKALTDLRTVTAGTYFLRVYQPEGVTFSEPLSYSIEVDAPTLGQSHPTGDRDRIRGGDGNDQLFGGEEIDALYGQSGFDRFRGDSIEVFDLDTVSGETATAGDTSNLSGPERIDPQVLVGSQIDPRLRARIASVLGKPVTVGFDGNPLVHEPIFASEVAEIQSLNLAGLGLTNVNGLEELRNLRSLDLSDNMLTSAPFPFTLPHLEVLDLSGNQIPSLQWPDPQRMPNLTTLFIEDNQIKSLADLAGIEIIDDRDEGYVEPAGQWQNEVFEAPSAWNNGYRFAKEGGTATYTFDVPDGETIDLFATWPTIADNVAADTTYQVNDGTKTITIPVSQSVPPQDMDFAGRPWRSLGRFTSTDGIITVTLTGSAGAVVADAVRAESVPVPQSMVSSIYLTGNPLNDVSRDELVVRLQDAGHNVIVADNANAPELAALRPVTVVESALSFDDEVVVLPREVLHGATTFMAEFWFKTDVAEHSTVISAAQSGTSHNELFYTLLNPTTVRVAYNHGAGLDFTVPASITESLADSRWHHHAIVIDDPSNTMRLYIDGQWVGTRSLAVVSLSIASGGLVLGQEQDDVNGNYDSNQAAYGELAELRFWNGFWGSVGDGSIEQHLIDNMNRTVPEDSASLRAYYRFNERSDSHIIDSSSNEWTGVKGDFGGDGPSDTRPGPTVVPGAPLLATATLDLSLAGGSQVDADGHSVTYSAVTDNPMVQATVVGNTLQVEYPTDIESVRVSVTATDEFGREDQTSFDLNVTTRASSLIADPSTASILTFEGPFALNGSIDQAYGDRIVSPTDGSFSYGGNANGPDTPNIEVEYSSTASYYPFGFGDLDDVVFPVSGPMEITLTADPGYQAVLYGFDMGAFQTDSSTPLLQVIDQGGSILFSQSNVAIPTGSAHRDFDFADPLVGQSLTIRFDRQPVGSNPIGIDNIEFAQLSNRVLISNQPTYGTVFNDINGNGIQDAGEPGIGGVHVNLYDGRGNAMLCTMTDVDGRYRTNADLFESIHSVHVVAPVHWEVSGPDSQTFDVGDPLGLVESSDLPFAYEFDVDPTDPNAIDLDGNGQPDFSVNGTPVVSDGVANLTSNQSYGSNDDVTTAWNVLNPSVESGFIVDLRARILTQTGSQGTMSIAASPDGIVSNALLSIGPNNVSYRLLDGSYLDLSSEDNTDGFHDFRIVQRPGEANQYYVYRDGVLLNPNGAPLRSAINFETQPRLIIGDGGSAWAGDAQVDAIRFGKADAVDSNFEFAFGLSKPIDIGPDRALLEGTNVTLNASGPAFRPMDFSSSQPAIGQVLNQWRIVAPDQAVSIVEGDSLDLSAARDGVYQIRFEKRVVTELLSEANPVLVTEHVDEMLLRVRNVAPNASIIVVQPTGNPASDQADLLVSEGAIIELSATIVDPGPNDGIASYRWFAVDSAGRVVEETSGTGDVPNWSLSIQDDGIYEIALTVGDGQAESTSAPLVVEVSNVAPELLMDQDDDLAGDNLADGNLTLSAALTDPGEDLWLAEADFGDGTKRPLVVENKSFEIEHQYERPGRYQVKVTVDDQDGGRRTETFEVDYQPAIEIQDFVVNGGDASRSQITSVGVTFKGEVDAPQDAFRIRNRDTGQEVTTFDYIVDQSGENTAIEWTFLPGPSVVTRDEANSLADGNYELVVSASGVQSGQEVAARLAVDAVFGSDSNDEFFRLFGDGDGDRDVDGHDVVDFSRSLSSRDGDTNYDTARDRDGDGDIDSRDFASFRRSFGKRLRF